MTPKLRSYLEQHRSVIEEDQFDTLYSLCPLNCKQELCLFLLECTDNDASIIPKDVSTTVIERSLQKYLPTVSLCYSWISYFKGTQAYYQQNPNPLRRGTITYIAVIDNNVVTGKYEWGITVDFFNVKILAEKCAEGLARHMKEQL